MPHAVGSDERGRRQPMAQIAAIERQARAREVLLSSEAAGVVDLAEFSQACDEVSAKAFSSVSFCLRPLAFTAPFFLQNFPTLTLCMQPSASI